VPLGQRRTVAATAIGQTCAIAPSCPQVAAQRAFNVWFVHSALIFANLFTFATVMTEPKNFVAEVRDRM
jgi:hypothetical protein